MPHRGENKRNSTLRCTKTGGIQPKLNVACFVQSCLTDADFVIFSNYCLIGTRPRGGRFFFYSAEDLDQGKQGFSLFRGEGVPAGQQLTLLPGEVGRQAVLREELGDRHPKGPADRFERRDGGDVSLPVERIDGGLAEMRLLREMVFAPAAFLLQPADLPEDVHPTPPSVLMR